MTTTDLESPVLTIEGPSSPFDATVEVPGDKSISHRSALFGAIAEGVTHIRGFLPATDCVATLEAVRTLGIKVECLGDEVLVYGQGLNGLQEPLRPVECGGSGTTMRLLAGLLAGQEFYSVLAGNAQLSKRPMDRIAGPLRQMGATVLGRQGGRFAPLSISGGNLEGITYVSPVASAQVKSAVLLAGLYAEGETTVREPLATRDHTERMLLAMGANLTQDGESITVRASRLRALDIQVPGDPSSAAFLLAAAAIVPGSRVAVPNVGVNPGRTGFLKALERMGARVAVRDEVISNGEPVATLELQHGELKGITLTKEDVPSLIDELPVLAVVATQATGITEVRGAGELRVKETDRIATIVDELSKMGAKIEARPDGFIIEGPVELKGAEVTSHGDHRLAMSLAIAGLAAEGQTRVHDTSCTDDSFPGFNMALGVLRGGMRG